MNSTRPLVGNDLFLSLIPHFKSDIETSYVTREYQVMFHYWFNPDKMETLLKVIENIEAWVVKDFEDKNYSIPYCYCGEYTFTVVYLEMLGTRYYRQEMSDLDAATILHDKQPFMMIANALVSCYSEDCWCTIV